MNRVLIAAPDDQSTCDYVATAFNQEGWQVTKFDYRQAAARIGPDRMNEAILDVGQTFDLVLALKGEIIQPATYRRLASKGVTTALWHFDPRNDLQDWILDRSLAVDHYFTIGKGLVDEYRLQGANAHWLLEGCDPANHHPVAVTQPERFPTSWVGTIKDVPGREEWLRYLADALGDDIRLFGSYAGCFDSDKRHIGRAPGAGGLNWVVSSSAVNLGRDRNPEIERSYGARLFRTLAAGGFLLTNQTIGVEQDFNGCLDTYGSTQDCLERIAYWLSHPEERQRVANVGHRLVVGKHTFRHRVKDLLQVVGK